MALDTNKLNASSNEGNKQKTLDQEVKELISSLTTRLKSIRHSHKSSGSSNIGADDQGISIITLAGTNLGATMRGDMDEKTAGSQGSAQPEQEDSTSYVVNSNFQAINNSIMMGGSYKTNDPGVHLDITDYIVLIEKKERKSKRGSHKSDRRIESSDKDSDTERS